MFFNSLIFLLKLAPSTSLESLLMNFDRTRVEIIHLTVDGRAMFRGTAPISDASMLLRSIFPAYSAAGYPIRPHTQPVTSMAVTANILFIGYFKCVDFGIETISSATESILLSFHVSLRLLDTIFTTRDVGCDHDHDHDGFERHDLVRYFLLITILQHSVAGLPELNAMATGTPHPPATPARPLVASRLDFPAGDGQAGAPCNGIWGDGMPAHDDVPILPGTIRQPIPLAVADRHSPETREGASFP